MRPKQISEFIYEIKPEMKVVKVHGQITHFKMKAPTHIYANRELMAKISRDRSIDQMTNVACLPGIQKHTVAMSDAHQGYGFCIGGVAATNIDGGAISPGGVGYDINCGVRLLKSELRYKDIAPNIPDLIEAIFHNIPSGLGSKGKLRISHTDLDRILDEGVNWAIDKGYGFEKDRKFVEDNGIMEGADSSVVSKRAKSRGIKQVGSLGSGNHFCEIQKVEEIFDEEAAKVLGIEKGNITVMIHTRSRAMGHQVCTDALQEINRVMRKKDMIAPDRELAYVVSGTKEADRYLKQMRAAANFA